MLASWSLGVYWIDAEGEAGLILLPISRGVVGFSSSSTLSLFLLVGVDLKRINEKFSDVSPMGVYELFFVVSSLIVVPIGYASPIRRPSDAKYGVYHIIPLAVGAIWTQLSLIA
eukprot:11669185-Prorocentrum_lima.AAC.1